MLGHDVRRVAERAGHELVLVDLPELDITDADAVEAFFQRERPEASVNCAAWTDVDGAETNQALTHAVNADGAGNLARAAARLDTPLLHISTDYVFDGAPRLDGDGRPRAYVESDLTGPRSVYGSTKLEGERQVIEASKQHTVVRTSWLYGVHGRNFVDTMLRLAGEREAVQVVDDQVGSPTWSGHLAPAIVGLLERRVSGLAHLTGAGEVSWNGFAQEIFRQAEVQCRVEVATSEQMARPAPRPAWSALDSERDDVLPLPPWQDGLAGYLAARNGMMLMSFACTSLAGRSYEGRGWHDALMKLLVCGGAGFIGSTFVRQRLQEHGDDVTVLDKLTYAGREENFHDFVSDERFHFVHGAIEDTDAVAAALDAIDGVDAIVNFAAETHVDRSIAEPDAFVRTHALGTYVLLEAARERELRYLQVSTDEVYGSIDVGTFTEDSPLRPSSPYSATKTGADLLVQSYFHTYSLPATIVPRLEQLRSLSISREADPVDGPQRAAWRFAACVRGRHAGA